MTPITPSILIVLLLAAPSLLGQLVGGRVVTSAGVPLGKVKISAVDLATNRILERTTSAPDGAWQLQRSTGASAIVFRAERYVARTLAPGSLTPDVVLEPETDLAEVRYRPVVDTERTHQADFVSLDQLQKLPVNRRSYLDLAALTPGVTRVGDYVGVSDAPLAQAPQSGLSFGGNNGRGNVFWLDGGENYINTGGVRPSLSQEAVAEFQVWRSNYSAEFGGGIGGIVNVISRAGTNGWHGSLFGFLRHRAFQSQNYFDPEKMAYTRSQAGAAAGGALRRDRTFWFASFERLQSRESAFVAIGREDRGPFRRLRKSQEDIADFLLTQGQPLATVGPFREAAAAYHELPRHARPLPPQPRHLPLRRGQQPGFAAAGSPLQRQSSGVSAPEPRHRRHAELATGRHYLLQPRCGFRLQRSNADGE